MHGANLVKSLKKIYPDTELSGAGGERLKALGQKQYFTDKEMAIIGFGEVLLKLPFILKMFSVLEKAVAEEKPDAVILIDYPGFNLRMAKRLKKYGVPIIYFIVPQFWVWDYKRIFALRDNCGLCISILPFEEEYFKKEGVNGVYVGNPVVDNFKFRFPDKKDFLAAASLKGEKPIIGILPGSREKEVKGLLPAFVGAAEKYKDKYDFIISKADSASEELIKKYSGQAGISYLSGSQYDIMKYSDFIWACSGTVTLETAIFKKPMLIAYTSSAINIFLVKRFTSIRTAGLPNIIDKSGFIPEIISSRVKPQDILLCHEKVLANLEDIKNRLEKISLLFIGRNPSDAAAAEIYSFLQNEGIGKTI